MIVRFKINLVRYKDQNEPSISVRIAVASASSSSECNLASSSAEVVVEALGNKSTGAEEVVVLEKEVR